MRFSDLHPGENVIADIPAQAATHVALLDENMHLAFWEWSRGRERLTVNGVTGRWYEEIVSLLLSPFPGYFYNFREGEHYGFVHNGQERDGRGQSGEDCRCWELARGDLPLWTCTGPESMRTFIGSRELEHNIAEFAELTADYSGFIYSAVDKADGRNEFLVRGDDVLFRGSVLDYEVHGDRTRLSWLGAPAGAKACHPYLNGREVDYSLDSQRYSPGSFTVCPEHRRYLLGEHKAHLGPVRVVVDGKAAPFQFPEPTLLESGFSADSQSWYCIADQSEGAAAVLRDNELLGDYARAADAQFCGGELVYTAQPQGATATARWNLFRDGRPDARWDAVAIEPDTLRSNAAGHLACVAHSTGSSESAGLGAGALHFVLDGTPLWAFDALPRTDSAYFVTDAGPVRFLPDGRVLCAGLKAGKLMIFVAEA